MEALHVARQRVVEPPNLQHLRFRDLGANVPRPLSTNAGSTAQESVPPVVCRSSNVEVPWVDTRGPVAGVADELAARNRPPLRDLPHRSVSTPREPRKLTRPIALLVVTPEPAPTPIRVVDCDPAPEPATWTEPRRRWHIGVPKSSADVVQRERFHIHLLIALQSSADVEACQVLDFEKVKEHRVLTPFLRSPTPHPRKQLLRLRDIARLPLPRRLARRARARMRGRSWLTWARATRSATRRERRCTSARSHTLNSATSLCQF